MIISVVNQKGGVGKTTTAVNVGAGLANLGKKVLLIDMDPQANLTYHLINKNIYQLPADETIYEILKENKSKKIDDILIEKNNVDIVPSSIILGKLQRELLNRFGRERILAKSISKVKKKYDYILIDCPPNLGILTINSLAASDEIIIPVQAEPFALQGLQSLIETIELIKEDINNKLSILGLVLTEYDVRRKITEEIEDTLVNHFGDKVFKTPIRINVAIPEASSHGKSVIEYAKSSHGADDYMKLSREIVNKGKI